MLKVGALVVVVGAAVLVVGEAVGAVVLVVGDLVLEVGAAVGALVLVVGDAVLMVGELVFMVGDTVVGDTVGSCPVVNTTRIRSHPSRRIPAMSPECRQVGLCAKCKIG